MSAPIIDGIDRALARFRVTSIQHTIDRHATITTDRPLTKHAREAPDRLQVIGIPLFIQRTPAWRRQPWDEPQTSPSAPTC
jgi:hypothetical protein